MGRQGCVLALSVRTDFLNPKSANLKETVLCAHGLVYGAAEKAEAARRDEVIHKLQAEKASPKDKIDIG